MKNSIQVFSLFISIICSLILIATLRVFNDLLSATKFGTIFCGFIGNWIFIFLLTCTSLSEMIFFGHKFKAQLFPEVAMCLGAAAFACGLVHRVSATACILMSVFSLQYLVRFSNERYGI
ncbi:KRTCAP2 family protein [Megaselia abdita]